MSRARWLHRLPSESILVSFSGFNGATPLGGLIIGSDGKFYGTTSAGGDFAKGVVYRLAIPLSARILSFHAKSFQACAFSGALAVAVMVAVATR